MGYNGCCNENTHKTCKGDDNICWCSQVCFEYGDCCSDIYEIGCFERENPLAHTQYMHIHVLYYTLN